VDVTFRQDFIDTQIFPTQLQILLAWLPLPDQG